LALSGSLRGLSDSDSDQAGWFTIADIGANSSTEESFLVGSSFSSFKIEATSSEGVLISLDSSRRSSRLNPASFTIDAKSNLFF